MSKYSRLRYPSKASGDGPRRRADQVFRQMLVAFTIGFALLAAITGILAEEWGIVLVLAVTYILLVVIALCGRRWLTRDTEDR
jgi:hypothetical protein